jgi:hypothetical protein
MASQTGKPRQLAGRLLLVDGRPTFIPTELAEVCRGVFPGGPPNLPPALPSTVPRGRGRRPKATNGTWEDDDSLAADVSAIVGSRDERSEMGAEVYQSLERLTGRSLARRLTSEEKKILRRLFYGTPEVRPGKASVIVRQILVWRHNVTDPDVRRMQRSLREPVAHDFTSLVLKYEAEQPLLDADGKPAKDEDGRPILVRPPVCDDDGQPILWVPDEHGQPSRPHVPGERHPGLRVDVVRPRVKMIFR